MTQLASLKIGPYIINDPVIGAPMAGVTDKPYRKVCLDNGAGMVVSEMVTSRVDLRHTAKTKYRSDLSGEAEPVVVQLVGTDPEMLAQAAQYNVANGAQVIDLNMGCPAKKVCKKAAGSALLAYPDLVAEIFNEVVNAVDVPVTVKIRTGLTPDDKNAIEIAKIAEDQGIQAITIHGRTRECKFIGEVEYDTIAAVKQRLQIPVIANGDINSPERALKVLSYTNADGIMIGRAAQGQPWLFNQIVTFLKTGSHLEKPSPLQRSKIILDHLKHIHAFYPQHLGVRLARKHIKWHLAHWDNSMPQNMRDQINTTDDPLLQYALMEQFLLTSNDTLAA